MTGASICIFPKEQVLKYGSPNEEVVQVRVYIYIYILRAFSKKMMTMCFICNLNKLTSSG